MVAVVLQGHRRSAAASVERRNAAAGHIRSWCTGCGRSTSAAFPATARCRRRGSTANLVVDARPDAEPRGSSITNGIVTARARDSARRRYFDLVRKAREAVKIPDPLYGEPSVTLTVSPRRRRGRFREGQPGLSRAGIAVDLRQHAAQRGPHLSRQGSFIPRLWCARQAQLPAQCGHDARRARGTRTSRSRSCFARARLSRH